MARPTAVSEQAVLNVGPEVMKPAEEAPFVSTAFGERGTWQTTGKCRQLYCTGKTCVFKSKEEIVDYAGGSECENIHVKGSPPGKDTLAVRLELSLKSVCAVHKRLGETCGRPLPL